MPISFNEDGEEEEDLGLNRLPGTSTATKGGLIVFKKPTAARPSKRSVLGLDDLAERRRNEKGDEEERHYRATNQTEETPTGQTLSDSIRANVQRYVNDKYDKDRRGIAAANDDRRRRSPDRRNKRQHEDEDRTSERRTFRDALTPQFGAKHTPLARSQWDDERSRQSGGSWDRPTPLSNHEPRADGRLRAADNTVLSTAHDPEFVDENAKREWEAEQKRLDRQW